MFIDSISKHFLSFTNVTTLEILTINFVHNSCFFYGQYPLFAVIKDFLERIRRLAAKWDIIFLKNSVSSLCCTTDVRDSNISKIIWFSLSLI